MSSDNYYVIRKHPKGGYCAVMGFMSDEGEPEALPKHTQYRTIREALGHTDLRYSEYGTHVHEECYVLPGDATATDEVEAALNKLIVARREWAGPEAQSGLPALSEAMILPVIDMLREAIIDDDLNGVIVLARTINKV